MGKRKERGVGLVEFSLLLVLIALIAVPTTARLGLATECKFSRVNVNLRPGVIDQVTFDEVWGKFYSRCANAGF